ncbi:MAG: homocysteine S-methyltransferase family protein [Oscillospiraceae bacterium]
MDVPLSLILDGATGTQLQSHGMKPEDCTEAFILDHPDLLLTLQKEYVAAGSGLLIAPTLGANRLRLATFGLEGKVAEMNRALVALTKTAAGGNALVAGDLASAGIPLLPFGELPFEELVTVYAEQASVLDSAGVDLFFVETMTHMAEARAAVLGIKSVSDKPIFVTFYCDDDGETPSGCDVLAALLVMQGMGVAAFGLGCCTPEIALEQLTRLAPYTNVPLIAKPAVGEETPAVLASYAKDLAAVGVRYFGGCCGSGPEHISALTSAVKTLNLAPFVPMDRDPDVIGAPCEKTARFITPDVDTGDTITCSPNLLEDILAAEEAPAGAVKIAIWDEDDLQMFAENQYAIEDALCLTTDVPALLEGALRAYQGRAFWDGTEELPDEFLAEMHQKYGLVIL